jgi:hypothetical protein
LQDPGELFHPSVARDPLLGPSSHAIDNEIGGEFVAIGRLLEQASRTGSAPEPEGIERRLDALAGQVYEFNLDLLKDIKARRHSLTENA